MNNWIWTIGLTLQLLLLGALVLRGTFRRLPVFTVLISFYFCRSIFLVAVSRHMNESTLTVVRAVLSLLDIAGQVFVAWELFGERRQDSGKQITAHRSTVTKPVLFRLGMFLALVAISALTSWGISQVVPSSPRSPLDRGILVPSLLILIVTSIALSQRMYSRAPVPFRVLAGFAVLAAAEILSQLGRVYAASQRNVLVYRGWSYEVVFVYLAVLLWWLAAVSDRRKLSVPIHRS